MLRSPLVTVLLFFCLGVVASLDAQTSLRLPLPVEGQTDALTFEVPGPTAAVLTGLLLPSSGPLTAWAPVWSTLRADGTLKESQIGAWTGPRPEKWLKIVRVGSVIGGFRVLVRTSPGPMQTRQAQIFWVEWNEGEAQGEIVTSRVYGQAAGQDDGVKIIELRLPDGAVPVGLYGQTVGNAVAQVSLIVRQTSSPKITPATAPMVGDKPSPSRGPRLPTVPTVGPLEPTEPIVPLLK